MTARIVAIAVLASVAGCGGGQPSAEGVVRAWAESVRTGDDEAAAELLAPGAEVIDGSGRIVLEDEREALRWTRREACAGAVLRIEDTGRNIEAEFDVATAARCDGADRERALFRVRDGRIVLLHRLPVRRDRPRVT